MYGINSECSLTSIKLLSAQGTVIVQSVRQNASHVICDVPRSCAAVLMPIIVVLPAHVMSAKPCRKSRSNSKCRFMNVVLA